MKFATLDDIRQAGFEGFVPIKNLQTQEQRRVIPDLPGIYMVLRLSDTEPIFKPIGSSHGREMIMPYAVEFLAKEWAKVRQAIIVYMGKAGGSEHKTHLRSRMSQYLRLNKGHKGGRAIWQFSDCDELLVCWKAILDNEPRLVESTLLQEFRTLYGAYPLANWLG